MERNISHVAHQYISELFYCRKMGLKIFEGEIEQWAVFAKQLCSCISDTSDMFTEQLPVNLFTSPQSCRNKHSPCPLAGNRLPWESPFFKPQTMLSQWSFAQLIVGRVHINIHRKRGEFCLKSSDHSPPACAAFPVTCRKSFCIFLLCCLCILEMFSS